MVTTNGKKRILILGGGFAGVYTAMYLGKAMTAAERANIEVTIVSNENYIVFQPFLPEVISGTIETLHCITPIRRMAKHAQLYTRLIEEIDIEKKTVRLAPEYVPKPIVLEYDHLVVGLGTKLNYDLVPGMREHAIPFKYLGDALRLRNQAVGVLEEAAIETGPEERKRLLTFVVGGGGFSGVECIAELNDFLISAIKAYPGIHRDEIRCVLLQSADRILPELGESLAIYAQEILESRGVEIQLNVRLKAVSGDGAIVVDKATKESVVIPSRTIVTTVPSAPHDLVTSLPCGLDRGRIVVTENMDVPDYPGLWAVGDCAAVPQVDGITSPPTAQHALRQAKTCANNILATIRGTKMKRFGFTGLGKLASLGRMSAVAEVFGFKMKGIVAWVFWRTVYLSKFPGFDRQIRIGIDWLLDLLLPRDITQVRIFQNQSIVQEHFHKGETIFDQGDYGDKLYSIVKGEAEIVVNGKVVATIGHGEVFGEIALVSDKPRTAAVIAKSDTDVISVSRSAYNALATHLPGVKSTVEGIMKSHGVDPTALNEPDKAPQGDDSHG
ncbi:MAG: FAD-dependent oxidoreductase [Planctomycetota bacterium]|nr:FAD-dependent oxidoreductase [Planctomycetota bacterium]MDA1164347.1 FAD-dependent oxidoreductase [Planctomycetota bacterium]